MLSNTNTNLGYTVKHNIKKPLFRYTNPTGNSSTSGPLHLTKDSDRRVVQVNNNYKDMLINFFGTRSPKVSIRMHT